MEKMVGAVFRACLNLLLNKEQVALGKTVLILIHMHILVSVLKVIQLQKELKKKCL